MHLALDIRHRTRPRLQRLIPQIEDAVVDVRDDQRGGCRCRAPWGMGSRDRKKDKRWIAENTGPGVQGSLKHRAQGSKWEQMRGGARPGC